MLDALSIITELVQRADGVSDLALPLQLRRAWVRHTDRLGLQYVDSEGRIVAGQWFAHARQTQRAFVKLDRHCGRAVLARAGQSLVVLQPFGADDKLPALEQLLTLDGAELVAHRPGRRAVVRIEQQDQVRFAKALRPSRVERIVRVNQFISELTSRAFEVAAIEHVDADAGCVVMRGVSGHSLHDLASSAPQRFIDGCRAAGSALRSMHVEVPGWLGVHDAKAEISMLEERLAAVVTFVPEMRDALMAARDKVFARLCAQESGHVVLHRDFYDKQVIVGADGHVALLDLDTLSAGEAALDVANMLAHLELRVLQGNCATETAAAAARAFVHAYNPDATIIDRTQAYLDATRLRLAMLYALWPKWQSLAPRLIDMIGSPGAAASTDRLEPVLPVRSARRVRPGNKDSKPCPLVFVVGCPRSGTTMLERMLDAHHELAMAHETHWVTKCAKRRRDLTREGYLRPETLDRLYADKRFTRMAPPREQIERLMQQRPLKYRRFVRLVFDHYRMTRGKRFVGDKSTGGYLRNIDRLHEVCPDSRIVHLVRDGRDVCLSMLNWPKNARAAGRFPMFADDPVATTAAWWQWHVRAGLERGRLLDAQTFCELRYEDLVREPERTCASLCAFLGLEPDPAMARFHAGRSKPGPGKSANAAWLAPTPGLRDWRTQMPDEQIEMFEAIAGPTLAQLGYERRFPRVSPNVARLAADRVARWERELGIGAKRPDDVEGESTVGSSFTEGRFQ